MTEEAQGKSVTEEDAEACAEALESLDRVEVGDIAAFDDELEADSAQDDEAPEAAGATGSVETGGADDASGTDASNDTGNAADTNAAAESDEKEGTGEAGDADAAVRESAESVNAESEDADQAVNAAASDKEDIPAKDAADEAPSRQEPSDTPEEPASDPAADADRTVLIAELPQDESLTRELPGLGSAPAVDETVAIGDIPLPSVPTAQQAEARHRHMSPRRRNLIVAGVIVAALAAGGAGYYAWNAYRQQEAAEVKANAHTMMSVKIGISAPGLKSSSGTKIPVEVTGQDADGTAVTETCYVDERGRGIKLMPGDYTFSIAASPIAADGTIYTVPTKKAQVTVKSDGQDLSEQAAFTLKVPSAETVTDEAIAGAAKYAEEGGCNSASIAKVLEQAATARRDAAVNAVTARKNQVAREADARHKATNLYQLDIPVEWYGKVATWQNGNTLCIYLAGDTSTPLVTLSAVATGEAFTPDDGDTQLGSVELGNGYTVYAAGPVYPYVVAQTINGKTSDSVSKYSMDSAVELVELTTGNRYTYDQIKNDLVGKDGKADTATKLESDYLAQILLPSIKAED